MKRITALMLSLLMGVSNMNIAYAEETPAPTSAPTSEPTAETIDVTPVNTAVPAESADSELIDVAPDASPSAEPSPSASASASADVIDVGTANEAISVETQYSDDKSSAVISISAKDAFVELTDKGAEALEDAFKSNAIAEDPDASVIDTASGNYSVYAISVSESGVYDIDAEAFTVAEDGTKSVVGSVSESVDIALDSNLLDVGSSAQKSVSISSTGAVTDISVADLARKIESGETLLFMVGNENDDELYQRVIKAYAAVIDAVDGETGTNFYKINSGDSIDAVLDYATDSEDASLIQAGWNDFANGTTGNAAIAFVSNRGVNNTVVELDDTDLYTVDEMAAINWSVKYDHTDHAYIDLTDYVTTPMTGLRILAKNNSTGTPSVALNQEWDYYASQTANNARKYNGMQTFTAPVAGTYFITLWGADGDSDTGAWTRSNVSNPEVTTGIGGQAGTVTGYVELEKGQTIYLALGFRNNMADGRVKYGGGGAGWGQQRGYRSGGGGYGAIMSSLPDSDNGGYTDLADYEDEQGKIMMVAGGGGGAEDFYAALDGHDSYYCEYNSCINSVGGNGGKNPTGGRSTGPTASTAGYKFALGQNYNSYENASSGGGGAGLMGGLSADGSSNVLKGGTGAGGTSYINESVVSQGAYKDGTGLTWNHSSDRSKGLYTWDNGRDAGATIKLVKYKNYKLTVNYLDVNNNAVVATQYNGTYAFGDSYSVTSPTVTGYTLADKSVDDAVVSGTMPDHDVVVDVYYDYPKLTINYLAVRDDNDDLNEDTPNDISDNKVLATQYVKRMKSGTPYSVPSPAVDGYEFFEADSAVSTIAGNMPAVDTVINVYYVPVWGPVKRISAVNGVTITREQSDAGVELTAGDIVTYEIGYENRRNTAVNKTVEDALASYLTYTAAGGYAPNPAPASTSGGKLVWNLSVAAKTRSTIKFSATVGANNSGSTVDNWTRHDPYVALSLVKSADPADGSYVATGENIVYTLTMKNTGSTTAHNIVIADAIPKGTEYVTMDTNAKEKFHGAYFGADGQSDGSGSKYVKYIIDELPAGAVAAVTFTVKNDVAVEGATIVDIPNIAGYQIYPGTQNKDDTSHDSWIISKENPHKSNQTVHHVTGTIISAVKSSNPVSGTTVDSGKEIEYKIDVTNEGPTAANYVRVTDIIPTGTTFVGGSLGMSGVSDFKQTEVFDEFSENHNYSLVQDTSTKTETYTDTTTHNIDFDGIVNCGGNYGSRYLGASGGGGNIADPNGHYGAISGGRGGKANIGGRSSYYYTYDLGRSMTFAGGYSIGASTVYSQYARVEASNDGSNWWTLSERTSSQTSSPYTVSYFNTTARYFRVSLEAHDNNSWGWVSWYIGGNYTTSEEKTRQVTAISGYHLSNVSAAVNGGKVTNVAINWTNGLAINGDAVDWNKWNNAAQSATSITLTPKATATGTDIANLLNALKWTGNVGTLGSTSGIAVNTTVNGVRVSKGYAGSSSACAYVTSNGAPYVECIGTNVAKGKHMYVTFKVKVQDTIPAGLTEIDNVAQYEGYSATEGGNTTNHPATANQTTKMPSSTTNMTVHPLPGKTPSITAVKSADPVSGSTVNVGDTIKYSVTVTNNGSAPAKFVRIRDYIPTGTTYVAKSASDDGVYSSNGYAEWVLTNLAAGASKTVTFSVTVNRDAPEIIKNEALYDMSDTNPGTPGTITGDPGKKTNEVNHNLNVITTPPSPGDPTMAIVKSSTPVSGTKMNRGDVIEYNIVVSNTSGNKAMLKYVPVLDAIPSGTTYVDGSVSSSGDAYEVTQKYDAGKNAVLWLIKDLKDGGSATLTFKVKIDKETELTKIVNSARYGVVDPNDVAKPSEFDVSKITDDMLTATTNQVEHPLTSPNVVVTKSSDPVTKTIVPRGSDIEYTLTVTNKGDGMANYVNVQDAIPEYTTYVNASASVSKDGDKAALSADKKSVQYQLYDLAAGETRTVKFTVTVNPSVQKGVLIRNVALYGDYIKNPNGEPGSSSFTTPKKKTNETEHTVEFGTDVIETGGRGWSTLPYIGAGILCAAVVVLLVMKKRKAE